MIAIEGAVYMCMYASVCASPTQTDVGVLQYVMQCHGITLDGSPGSAMLYFVTFAELKSPEHRWVHVTDTVMPSHWQWANTHCCGWLHMDTNHDGVFMA